MVYLRFLQFNGTWSKRFSTEYCRVTVIRFRFRLAHISLFIQLPSRPLLACPKRVIFQLVILPLIICGLLSVYRTAFSSVNDSVQRLSLVTVCQLCFLDNLGERQALKRGWEKTFSLIVIFYFLQDGV